MTANKTQDLINQGYSDAYFGKDNSCNYTGDELKYYLEGKEAFYKQFEENGNV